MVLAATLLILPALGAEDKPKEEAAAPWRLATDARAAVQLQAAADYMRDKDWKKALRLLQHLLDGQPDTLARLADREGKAERIVSVHAEAERLLASLPEAGRRAYQRTYGPSAADLLEEAHEGRDAELLSRIVERYLYTDAGPAALCDLARRYARDGRLALAALGYARLLEHVGLARWSNEDLYQAAVAFHHRGSSARTDQMLKQLLARTGQNVVHLGERKLTVEELRKEIERAVPSPRPVEWPLYCGDAARRNHGVGELPLLQPLWRQSMFYKTEGSSADAAQEQIRQAEKKLQEKQEPIIPAFSPLAVTVQQRNKKRPLLLCRTYFGVEAIDLRDGSLAWLSASNLSLQRLLDSRGGSKQLTVVQWLSSYHKQHPQILFENSTIGTLSTDGEFVYAVEDLAVPPSPSLGFGRRQTLVPPSPSLGFGHRQTFSGVSPSMIVGQLGKGKPSHRSDPGDAIKLRFDRLKDWAPKNDSRHIYHDPELEDAIGHNRLFALGLATNGKLTWELPNDEKGPFADCYFLGPPLPLDGLLYMLIQKKKQISLLCIDPKTKKQQIAQPSILFVKPLVEIATSLLDDPIRRTRAAHLAYADGILVCPTNAGVLVGVDLLSNRLAWVYPYLEREEKPPDDRPAVASNANRWKTTAPVLGDGKVVFAPPDAPSIHCLNLADGSLLWSRKKSRDDVYLAGVYGGKVLIVGIRSVHALSLTTGESVWTQETGLPSGQGVAAGDRYYLPLQRGAQSKQPEILVLAVAKGQVMAHIKTRPSGPGRTDFEVPGNLVFAEGKLISQSAWQIIAYPLLQDNVDKVNEGLKQNPDDGYLQGYWKLTDMYLEGLTREMLEQALVQKQRKLFRHYSLLARLCENQKRLTEALQAYLDLSGLSPSEELLPLPDEPAVQVRLDLWVRGRIVELLKKATPEECKQLEAEMERRLKEIRDRKDDDQLRGFLELAGVETAAGREARLMLAERLLGRRAMAHFLQAELHLLQVRDHGGAGVQAARAVETLGQLMTARGLLPDAVYFYRLLHRDFGKIVLPDGKNGADIWDALTVDKRFLPYLTESDAFAARRFKARKETGNFAIDQPILPFEHTGEELPFFRRHRVGLEIMRNKFHIRNRRNGEDVWTANLLPFHNWAFRPDAHAETWPRFRCHTQGHLLVVPLDNLVFGIDVVGRCIAWQKDTHVKSDPPKLAYTDFDSLDGSPRPVHADGWIQFPEHNLVLSASVLCLASQTGLHGYDPLTGRLLWTRTDLPRGVRLFGDAEHVFVVEENEKREVVSTRVLRLADGGTVAAPEFTTAFAKRVQIHGRTLVLSHTNDKDAVTLRLYDIPTGAVGWERTFAAKSLVMHSEESGFAGVVEPNGKVHVIEVAARKEVMTGQIPEPAEHLRNVRKIHLLADDRNFYLALSAPTDAARRRELEEERTDWYDLGRSGVPVNGMLYAFARGSGECSWYIPVENQRLVREQLHELPLLFLMSYSRASRPVEANGRRDLSLSALCVHKREGRIIYRDTMKAAKPFFAVRADPQTGTIESVSTKVKIVCQPHTPRGGK
jgi:hypothetical protein